MHHLAVEMLHASEVLGKTPVLVFPRSIKVRAAMLIDLVQQIKRTQQSLDRQLSSIRFDWMLAGNGLMSVVSDHFAARKANQLSESIRASTEVDTLVQVTATIGRPSADAQDFVGGWTRVGAELPDWTSEFRFRI